LNQRASILHLGIHRRRIDFCQSGLFRRRLLILTKDIEKSFRPVQHKIGP
jgi:hypothetical protein